MRSQEGRNDRWLLDDGVAPGHDSLLLEVLPALQIVAVDGANGLGVVGFAFDDSLIPLPGQGPIRLDSLAMRCSSVESRC